MKRWRRYVLLGCRLAGWLVVLVFLSLFWILATIGLVHILNRGF